MNDEKKPAPNSNSSPSTDIDNDYDKPVAYDSEGRPLYAHPPEQSALPEFRTQAEHQYVHVRRPMNPAEPDVPPEIMERYEASHKKYPNLNLSKGEYVISAVKRHPFGLVQIWAVALILIAAMVAVLASFLSSGSISSDTMTLGVAGLGVMAVLIFMGAFIASYIYNSNRFYLTNESVIQEIQISLLSKHEQTVSLSNIEDASYYQQGIFSYMFDFGTIRLSTEGDETTYKFSYVASPKREISVLNNAVEAFKNGRPVDPNENPG